MPLYEYICSQCEYQDDVLGKSSDDSLVICPACNNKTFQKQVSAPHFKLKGSGWYETDFKNKPKSENHKPSIKKDTKTITETSKNHD